MGEDMISELPAGLHSLTFMLDDSRVDEAIADAGHEPSGHFWETVAEYVIEDNELAGDYKFESDDDSLVVIGKKAALEELWEALEPYTRQPALLDEVLDELDFDGVDPTD